MKMKQKSQTRQTGATKAIKDIPLFGKGRPFLQSSRVITTLVCGIFLLEISTLTHTRTPQKHGKGQAESSSQISHRGSLTDNAENGESG